MTQWVPFGLCCRVNSRQLSCQWIANHSPVDSRRLLAQTTFCRLLNWGFIGPSKGVKPNWSHFHSFGSCFGINCLLSDILALHFFTFSPALIWAYWRYYRCVITWLPSHGTAARWWLRDVLLGFTVADWSTASLRFLPDHCNLRVACQRLSQGLLQLSIDSRWWLLLHWVIEFLL